MHGTVPITGTGILLKRTVEYPDTSPILNEAK